LTPEIEEKLEKMFWKLVRKKDFHGMDRRWGSGELDYYKLISKNGVGRKNFYPEYL